MKTYSAKLESIITNAGIIIKKDFTLGRWNVYYSVNDKEPIYSSRYKGELLKKIEGELL